MKDVELTRMEYLIENFQEYIELRDKLMSQTPYLRGQIEDVAKAGRGLSKTSTRPVHQIDETSPRIYTSLNSGGAKVSHAPISV